MLPTFFRRFFYVSLILSTCLFLIRINPSNTVPLFPHIDKIAHIIVFTGLGFFALCGFNEQKKQLFGFLAIYGISIELLQGLLPFRSASVLDWIADIVGVLLAFQLIKFAPIHWYKNHDTTKR